MIPEIRAPSLSSQSSERSLRRIFVLLAATAVGMAVLLALLPPAGHDQLWFLLMARRWLGGARLYGPQIFDSNPPAIVWLSALPVLLSRGLHLPVTLVAKSLVILAEIAAAALSFTFLRRSDVAGRSLPPLPAVRVLLRYRWPFLLFAGVVLFCVVPARDFGQRDQILSFLVLPYLLAASIPPRRHRLTLARSVAGILAGAGICLKPQHALVPAAVELALLLILATDLAPADRLRRLLRPEPVLITLIGVAYVAAIFRLAPLYFTVTLPILHETYWAIGHLSIAALAFQGIDLCILAVIATVLFFAFGRRTPAPGLMIVAGWAATLAYFLQGTGWYYQQLPAIGFFGAALALQLLDLLDRRMLSNPRKLPKAALPAAAALCIVALALTTWFNGSPFTRARAYAPVFADPAVPDPAFFASLPPHSAVAILTTSVEATMMPVERFRLTWGQRTDNLWLLPAILRSEAATPAARLPRRIPPAQLASLDTLQHRWMVEDLTRWRPSLILVARCQSPKVRCQELEDLQRLEDRQQLQNGTESRLPSQGVDLLVWFLRDPTFAALWRQYSWSGSRGGFDAYTLQPPVPGAHLVEQVAPQPPVAIHSPGQTGP